MATRESESPLRDALAAVGDRWTLLVVEALLDGPRRFNGLLSSVPGIASNILSQRLRHLEKQGLVVAAPYSTRPTRFTYELTQAGRELAGALRLLTDWGSRRAGEAEPPRHSCGTPLEASWYCRTCETAVDDDESLDLRFV
ncbi:MAG: helix-turn-helix domain-containing protein [Actinomycetota bacterium]